LTHWEPGTAIYARRCYPWDAAIRVDVLYERFNGQLPQAYMEDRQVTRGEWRRMLERGELVLGIAAPPSLVGSARPRAVVGYVLFVDLGGLTEVHYGVEPFVPAREVIRFGRWANSRVGRISGVPIGDDARRVARLVGMRQLADGITYEWRPEYGQQRRRRAADAIPGTGPGVG
jgi:hypothetical protein